MGVANGTPAVLIIINRQPGANIIETVDRVRAILPQLEASIPRQHNPLGGGRPDSCDSCVAARRRADTRDLRVPRDSGRLSIFSGTFGRHSFPV